MSKWRSCVQLPDVNVLIYAFNVGADRHAEYRDWLEKMANGPQAYAISELVLSSVVRIVTQARFFAEPATMADALAFVEPLRGAPQSRIVHPGARHWEIFVSLCHRAKVRGAMVTDAYLAALAIEHGCELMTTDMDFARFPGLAWRDPCPMGGR
jgi:toxin-antitoxin system PIN domain toxin